uniref:Uncharacterized protein n=1 Tax=Arundo donax TaxID=35708 RepID=A0A0A9GLR3_ARUDO
MSITANKGGVQVQALLTRLLLKILIGPCSFAKQFVIPNTYTFLIIWTTSSSSSSCSLPTL